MVAVSSFFFICIFPQSIYIQASLHLCIQDLNIWCSELSIDIFFKFFPFFHIPIPCSCIVLASSLINSTNLDLFRYPISVSHLLLHLHFNPLIYLAYGPYDLNFLFFRCGCAIYGGYRLVAPSLLHGNNNIFMLIANES